MTGMRSSSGGTRASRAGEPYPHDANVTDAARVRRSCRTPDTLSPHTSLSRWLRGRGMKRGPRTCLAPAPRPEIHRTGERARQRPDIPSRELQTWYARPRGQKGTYGSTTLATRATPEPLAGSRQGRSAADQGPQRGREAVGAVGVTPPPGHGSRRGRAKGLRPDQLHDIQTRLARGRIMAPP
jgi:hypothetical protein